MKSYKIDFEVDNGAYYYKDIALVKAQNEEEAESKLRKLINSIDNETCVSEIFKTSIFTGDVFTGNHGCTNGTPIQPRKLYWVSAIIQNKGTEKPELMASCSGNLTFDKAMEEVSIVKSNFTVLSAWIDTFDDENKKQTVFHECYINAFGDIEK